MKKILQLATLMALFLFLGCTHTYWATMYPVPTRSVQEFRGNNTVSIENRCEQKEPFLMEDLLGDRYYANLVQATDVAAQVLENALVQRGFKISESAQKKIKLNIESITYSRTYYVYFYTFNATTTLLTETGDGYKQRFNGNNVGGEMSWPWRSCDGSITKAVAAMLNDQNIINYLTEAGPKPLEPPVKDTKQEIKYPDGSKYVGNIVNGMKQGRGTYAWPDGNKYVGEFKDDKASGGWLYESDGSKSWYYQDTKGNWIKKGQ